MSPASQTGSIPQVILLRSPGCPMHCVTLADLAATLAGQAVCFEVVQPGLESETIMQYWTASRSRHELWHRAMARYRNQRNADDYYGMRRWWLEHDVVLEEVLVSELLARVVATVAAQAQRSDVGSDDNGLANLAAIAHGVFLSQTEASNRVARIVLEATGASIPQVVRLNRLRFGVQRWTDWLIGSIANDFDRAVVYCVDVDRAKEFHHEMREIGAFEFENTTRWLMNAAMREMLVSRTSPRAGLAQANYEVALSVIGLFQSDLFDDYGVLKSSRLHRLQQAKPLERAVSSQASLPLSG